MVDLKEASKRSLRPALGAAGAIAGVIAGEYFQTAQKQSLKSRAVVGGLGVLSTVGGAVIDHELGDFALGAGIAAIAVALIGGKVG